MKLTFHNLIIIYFIVTKFVVIHIFDLHVQCRIVLKFIFRVCFYYLFSLWLLCVT